MPSVVINHRKKKRKRVGTLKGRSPQVFRTNLSVSPSGASIAIRPPRTALRRMDTSGRGSVGYF